MNVFLSRLEAESAELESRLEKLTKFNQTEPFYKLKFDDQNDLTEQLYCMSNLSGILRKRIAKAKGYYSGYIQTHNGTDCVGSNESLPSLNG